MSIRRAFCFRCERYYDYIVDIHDPRVGACSKCLHIEQEEARRATAGPLGVARIKTPDYPPASSDLPARYHAALDEVEAKAKATQRAILQLLHEFEQSTGAEVKGIQIQRRWLDHKPSYVDYVTLNLEALPQGRRRVAQEER